MPFNGGKTQIGMQGTQSGGDYPFLNFCKSSQYWSYVTGSGAGNAPVPPDTLDANGYPLTTPPNNGIYTAFFIPTQSARPGTYKMIWDGIGTIYMPNAVSITGSKTSATGAGGSFTFTPTTENINWGIVSVGSPPITNARFYHTSDEALLNGGAVFGTKFKQRIMEANFGVIRFMDWLPSNTGHSTTWWTRRSTSYVTYGSSEYRASIYGGVTTNVANDYSVAAPAICSATGSAWDGVLRNKTTVLVIFNVSATQSGLCTLKVGTTAAKNILNAYSNALTAGGNSYPTGGTWQSLAALVYDANLDAWIKQGGDQASNSNALNNGVPPELMLQLCIEVGAHPWFIAPAHALDGNTDYMTSLATYVRDNKPSWLIPRFEGPNELWNTFAGFYQCYFAQNTQAVVNGVTIAAGVPTTPTYTLAGSGFVYPSALSGTGFSDILFTTAHSFTVGSRVLPSGFGGIGNLPVSSGFYVTAINVGGNANKITVQFTPAGSYSSGGTVTPHLTDYHNWYGGIMSRLGQAVSTVFSNNRTQYQILCGVQTGYGDTSGNRATMDPRLSSPSYVLRTPPSGYTATPASNWVTHICCAQYIGPEDKGGANETTATNNYAGCTFTGSIAGTTLTTSSPAGTIAIGMTIQGIGVNGAAVLPSTTITGGSGTSWTVNNSQTVASMYMTGGQNLTAPVSYANSTNGVTGAFTVTKCAALYSGWKSWAQGFGIQNMCGYEGGYSPDFSSNGNSNLDRMRAASKLAPNLQTYLRQTYLDFTGLTDGTFTAEFPSMYFMTSNPYINGYVGQAWSALDDLYQAPDSPQWTAIVAFNAVSGSTTRQFSIRTA